MTSMDAASSSLTANYGSRRSSARCEAELIQARGRICQLELELEMTKTQHAVKRARTEDSSSEEGVNLEKQASSTSQELQRLHTVRINTHSAHLFLSPSLVG